MSVSAIYQDFKNSIETSVQQHSQAPDVAADAVAQVENVLGGAAEVVHDVQEIVQG